MSAILKQKLIDIANGFTKYGLWKGGGSGGSSALSDMTDVTLTNLKANDVLKYNGSVWVNDDNLVDLFFSKAQYINYSFDYNNLTTNGLYYLNGPNPLNCNNSPEACTNCYVIVFGESGRKHQIILAGNQQYAWYRNMVTDTTTWRVWKQIGNIIMNYS